ncbi:hypothetical protein CRE_16095 [Caenorhabditis remanei]|uniref:Uncharacterized protein n=1 Tax=Caenorhabditis remanei TaxID=31234 RepID=E3MBT3_CAERE|nr:hypothetical protein CRE_16095 [Caenorhabditis remanei]
MMSSTKFWMILSEVFIYEFGIVAVPFMEFHKFQESKLHNDYFFSKTIFSPKHEYWWSNGHLVSIASYLKREWAVQSNHPSGPYVYIKKDENSLYPIDLVHHIEAETDEEIQERQQLEKKERWDALISVSKQITVLGRKHGYVKDLNFKNELSKKVEKLARRMIGITLNS